MNLEKAANEKNFSKPAVQSPTISEKRKKHASLKPAKDKFKEVPKRFKKKPFQQMEPQDDEAGTEDPKERPDQMVYPVSKEGIDDAMRVFLPSIRKCYQDALKQNPEIKGKILAAFTIEKNAEGSENSDIAKISDVEILESELEHEDFENCMMDNLDQLWFDPPQNGPTNVQYPFLFSY